jgi:hypothetical protein
MCRPLFAFFVACLLAFCLGIRQADAAGFTVCPPNSGLVCSYTSIQTAVDEARSNAVITLSPGTFSEANIVIQKNLTIQGSGARNTILQPAVEICAADMRIFKIVNASVHLADMTIQNGCAPDTAGKPDRGQGGAIWSVGTLVLHRVIVQNSTATTLGEMAGPGVGGRSVPTTAGGAIFSVGSTEIDSSSIINNEVNAGDGLALGGGLYANGLVKITNSTFGGNSALGANAMGGAIFNDGTLDLEYTTVVFNLATNTGGGIGNAGTLSAASSLVISNTANFGPEKDCVSTPDAVNAQDEGNTLTGTEGCQFKVVSDVILGSMDMSATLPIYIPALNSGSIDSGPCILSSLTVDQLGNPRPQGRACDAGAVETGRNYLPNVSVAPPVTDLVVNSITTEPGEAINGATPVTLTVVIQNLGDLPAGRNFWVDLYINPKSTPPNYAGTVWSTLCKHADCKGDQGVAWKV